MSIRLMSAVWEAAPVSQTALLVLLAIADHADDDGRAWPSLDRLAQRARTTERHVRRILRELEDAGWLEAQMRPGKVTLYTLTPDTQVRGTPRSGGHEGPATPDTQVRNPGHPDPPNHQEASAEPPTTMAVAAPAAAAPPGGDGGLTAEVTDVAEVGDAEIAIHLADTDDPDEQRANLAAITRLIAAARDAGLRIYDKPLETTPDGLYRWNAEDMPVYITVPDAKLEEWLARIRHWIDPTAWPAPPEPRPTADDPLTAAGLNPTQAKAFIAWLTSTGVRNPGGLIRTLDRTAALPGRIAEWKATRPRGSSVWDKTVTAGAGHHPGDQWLDR